MDISTQAGEIGEDLDCREALGNPALGSPRSNGAVCDIGDGKLQAMVWNALGWFRMKGAAVGEQAPNFRESDCGITRVHLDLGQTPLPDTLSPIRLIFFF